MPYNFSKVESDRFGLNIFRGHTEEINPAEIRNCILDNDVDILILRVPGINKFLHAKLQHTGFEYLHADSLVYYTNDKLQQNEMKPLKNNLAFIPITNQNAGLLKEIIPIIFKDYQNHYFSNPYLNADDITEGYVEWAENYVSNQTDRISWFIKSDDTIIGFATWSFDNQLLKCEGVLNGILPEYRGKGIYSDLIRYSQKYFKDLGFQKMLISTQLQNYAVQKTWIKDGFYLLHSYETYHINSFLNYSQSDKIILNMRFSERDIKEFAKYSSDYNPSHFSADFAGGIGVNDRIVNETIVQVRLSEIFRVHYPENSTEPFFNRNIFLAPIYLNLNYKIVISTIKVKENGMMFILTKIINEKNKICLLSYNQFPKKAV